MHGGPEASSTPEACWRLLDRFNATTADDDDERFQILGQLVAEVGPGAVVMPRFQCSYGSQIHLGANSFVNCDALFMDDAEIRLGADVRIGPHTQLRTALHPMEDHERRREGWERPEAISIGRNAWLGGGVIVCPGVTVGENAVVGAGSVVTRDVPPRVFVAGNPARVIRAL